ncbi:hypothetical protein K466DRAFT_585109 [Polyporus arcularius HHB13444]|uniref:Uncharacterized protein n=1 Tax=Polyporus arcularius HHB13444 TaxID=1314778 RepID=A0A5C3PGP0_9APHY|nr:hypothetical protein K466DRAFT_585109 [Polyporus arcularius HHB13444]
MVSRRALGGPVLSTPADGRICTHPHKRRLFDGPLGSKACKTRVCPRPEEPFGRWMCSFTQYPEMGDLHVPQHIHCSGAARR